MSNPQTTTTDLLRELDRFFFIQISRFRMTLFPRAHSIGPKRPDMTSQEAIMFGEVEQEEDAK